MTITGANFGGSSIVRFGTAKAVGVKVLSATSIRATAPSSSGSVHVTVSSAKGTSPTSGADSYAYASGPRVLTLSPSTAKAAGGSVITVSGGGFATSSIVKVGGTNAKSSYVSSSTLKVTVPASSTSSGYVVVTTSNKTSPEVSRARVTYLRPTVGGLSVKTGPTEGGQVLTVTGTRFTGASRVYVGTAAVTPTSVTSTSLRVNTPKGAAGTVDVRVVTSEGAGLTTAADRYGYTSAPILTSVATSLGNRVVAAQGGGTVTLTGFNLGGLTTVQFGTASVDVESATATKVSVTAPGGRSVTALTAKAGSVSAVKLSSLQVVYSDRDDRYRYDGLGRVISSTDAAGTSTTTVWDPFAGAPTPLVHGDWRLITGPGSLPVAQVDGSNTAYYPVVDQRGSTRALLDSTGAMVSGIAYGPYGAVTASTGTIRPVLGFAGGLSEANGLVRLGQRVLDPSTGTFLTVDPALALTGNPYAYAGADPYNAVDRTGLWPVLLVTALIAGRCQDCLTEPSAEPWNSP